jgi:hypothetical protein
MKTTLSLALLCLAGVPGCLAAEPVHKDCAQSCAERTVQGDPPATLPTGQPSPFRGMADATVRADPIDGTLWMAYSRAGVRVSERRGLRAARATPEVVTHLARSRDQGASWTLAGALWGANPAQAPDGEPGHFSHEVANLLPISRNGRTVWLGARVDYFLPDAGGFRKRPPGSFRLVVMQANSPMGLSHAPAVRLAAMGADPAWGKDFNLAALSPQTQHCQLWNEPALHYEDGELFMALSCMAFRGRTPDVARNDLVLFATRAEGDPAQWQWRFAGRLAGSDEAQELGAQRLTQIELARGIDGTLLALVTPDTWSAENADFVHHGCAVLELARTAEGLQLARGPDGRLRTRARILASDAGAAGTAACAYDPRDTGGVLLGRRIKHGVSLASAQRGSAEMVVSIQASGVRP